MNCIRSLNSFLGNDITIIPVHVNDNVHVGVLSTMLSGMPFMAATGNIRNVSFGSNRSYLVISSPTKFTRTIVTLSDGQRLRERLIARTRSDLQRMCGPKRVRREELTICRRVLKSGIKWS